MATKTRKPVDGGATDSERLEAHLEALEREGEGYDARVAAAKAGRTETLTVEQLADRRKQVDEQIAAHKKLLGKASK